jgi:hypothetical protein
VAAIDACHTIDEACEIRDQALALVVYTHEAKNTGAERKATEIRWRAERRCGVLLGEIPQYAGARLSTDRRQKDRSPKKEKLAELGISKHQCSCWERLAAVPDERFEAALASAKLSRNSETFLRFARTPQVPKSDRATALATRLCRRLVRMNSDGTLGLQAVDIFAAMTAEQREIVREIGPRAIGWLTALVEIAARQVAPLSSARVQVVQDEGRAAT